jgi:H-type small acid-soluble spore protein
MFGGLDMDKKRAQEIISSPNTINVTHLGTPVYLDRVNDDGTCTIHTLGEHDKKYEVPLNNLFEAESDNR